MTSPNKPDFTLPDFEQLLSRFLAGEQLSPQEKKQLGKHVEQLKQQQVTKHNLFDLFDQVPDQDAIMKRLEAHFARVADVVKDWQGDLTKLNDLPLLSTLHTYTKLWSLKDPANQATKPTPPKSPPKPKNTPQNKQAQTPDAILQARNTETKQQQRMRDEVIDKALHLVKFPTKPYMESIQQQVIDILQKHAVLPANASDTLKNKVMDFLWDRVKDQSFSKQPRFKAWIGDYINWKYYNEADFACDAISCESVVASIKNDIGPFFAFPPLEQVIVDEARASKYFHVANSTKPSSTNNISPVSGETKEQRAERFAREKMIIQGLDEVRFQGPVFGKLMEGVIKLLQREGILPRKVTSEQERILKDFLHKKNPNHPFPEQPRFKFWMATNLEGLFSTMAKPIAGNAYLKAVEMIRDDIPGFLREPAVVAQILKQVTDNNLFAQQHVSQKTPTGPNPNPTPASQPVPPPAPTPGNQQNRTSTQPQPTTGPTVAPNVVPPKLLKERYIWLPARTHLTVNTVGKAESFFQELAEHPMQIDGVETKVTYKSSQHRNGTYQAVFARETLSYPGQNPNFFLTINGEAGSLGNDGKQYTHEVRVGRVPGTLVASTTPNEIKQECSALAHMLLVCPDIKALYTHLHQTDPVFYPEKLIEKLTAYAHAREQQLPGLKTISLFEFSHLFAPASRVPVLQYLIAVTGMDETDIVELQNFIDASATTPDVPAPDPDLPTQEEIRQAALAYLLNPHVVNTPEKIDEKLANDPSLQRNAETLSVIEKKYGKQVLMDLATTIHDQFHHALAFIEGTDTDGMARAYRDIAKQYYFFSHPETHDAQVAAGYVVGNPMEEVGKQKEIVDRMFGWYLYSEYTKGRPLDSEQYQIIDAYLAQLPSSTIKQEILALFEKLPTDDGRTPTRAPDELSSRDLAHLGALFTQTLPDHPDQLPVHRFDAPIYAGCRERTERDACAHELWQELASYAQHDDTYQLYLQQLETEGCKHPLVRQKRMRNRLTNIISTPVQQRFNELLAEREVYRAEQIQHIRNDDAVHTPLLNQVVDELKQTLTPAQLAMFNAYDFDTSPEYIDSRFVDRWDSLEQFPATAQEAYTQVLKLVIEQQWEAHCTELGEVPQWTDDGGRNVYDALREKDTLDRNDLRAPWMASRTDAEHNDPDLQRLKNICDNAKGLAKAGRWVDLQIATLSTMADRKFKRLKHKFKDFESYYAEKKHKHAGWEIFSSAPKANRTAQQDAFFQALGVHSVQVEADAGGSQYVTITMLHGGQPGSALHFDLAQNQRFQPHHILEHIYSTSTLATPEQKRAVQRCYLKTYMSGVLHHAGALHGEYQGQDITVSLDHQGGLRIQHDDEIWSESSLTGASTLERNQQLLRVYRIWQQCFPQAGEKVEQWKDVRDGKYFETKGLEKFARKQKLDSISSETHTEGAGDTATDVTTRTLPEQESLNYFTFVVAGKTYAWSSGQRYILKTQPAAQGQSPKLIFDKSYDSRKAFLTELGNEGRAAMQAWTLAYLKQRLGATHQTAQKEIALHYAGSRYKLGLDTTQATPSLSRQLLATKPSPEYTSLSDLADQQRVVAGIHAYSDQLLVIDTKKEVTLSRGWFSAPEKRRDAQVSMQDLVGTTSQTPPQTLASPPLLTDFDSLDLLVEATQAHLK